MLKTASSVTNALGALVYQGTWNASSNSPALASGVGVKGYYYVVSVAGTTNLDGINLWSIGDWAVFNGTTWQKVDGGTSEAYVNLTVSGTANIATGNVANFVSANVQITGGTENAVTYTNVSILSGTFSGTNVAVSNGVISTNQFNGAYSDGTVVDYTSGNGRISVGINDVLTFYAGGPGNVATGNVTATGTWNLPNVSVSGTITGNVSVTGGNVAANLSASTNVPVANAVGTLAVLHGGTGVTTSTGSGNTVLSTSPTLTTPVLGTPTSGNLSNCTSIPVANATGTLAVSHGGTGVTTSTGSGNLVLSGTPSMSSIQVSGSSAFDSAIFGIQANGSVIFLRDLVGSNRLDSYNWPITQTWPLVINAQTIDFQSADSSKMKMFASGGVSIGNTTDPGAGNLRFNTTGSNGIYFGASSQLNDYETGTWTPSYSALSGSFGSITYSYQTGVYTKVGNLITAYFAIGVNTVTTGTAATALLLSGLPFTASNGTTSLTYRNAWLIASPDFAQFYGAGVSMLFRTKTLLGYTNTTPSAVQAGTEIIGSVTYFA